MRRANLLATFFLLTHTKRETFPERFDGVGRGKKKADPPTHDRGGSEVVCIYVRGDDCIDPYVCVLQHIFFLSFFDAPVAQKKERKKQKERTLSNLRSIIKPLIGSDRAEYRRWHSGVPVMDGSQFWPKSLYHPAGKGKDIKEKESKWLIIIFQPAKQ
jgi:hypothetical protein